MEKTMLRALMISGFGAEWRHRFIKLLLCGRKLTIFAKRLKGMIADLKIKKNEI